MTVEAIKACPCCGGDGKLKDIHTRIRKAGQFLRLIGTEAGEVGP